MRVIALITILIIVTFFTGCGLKSADTYLQESKLASEKGDYNAAIILLNKATYKNPKLKEAYIQRGLCYENIHQDDAAINDYKTLLIFDPENTTAFYYTGLCKYRQNKFEEAIENYNKALITKGIANPSDTTKIEMVIDLNKNGILTDEVSFDILASQIYYERGLAYYSSQQIKRAFYDFKNCIAQKYNLDECLYMSGLCWQAADKKDKACEAFKQSSAYGNNMAKNHLEHLCK